MHRWLGALAALIASAAVMLPASAQAATASHSPTVAGYYHGHAIKYLDFGLIHLAKGNRVAPIWSVTNGVARQHNIVDVVPGQKGYTPLWRVITVTFKKGAHRSLVTSAGQVRALERAGKVRLKTTNMIVNCPVLGFAQKPVQGYEKGKTITYLDLGPVKLRAGNKVAPLWTVTNGTSEQHNVVDVLPGDAGYSPLWSINQVTWKHGVSPRTLRSRAEVDAAAAAGDVTIKPTAMVVNCPVV